MEQSQYRLLNEAELRKLPEPKWLITDVIPARGLVLIYSAPGQGKSILAAAMCGSGVTGLSFFGRDVVTKGTAVSVPVEDLLGFRARWFRWRAAAGIAEESSCPLHTWKDALNFYSGDGFDQFDEEVARVAPSLVVVDTWAWATAGADENSAKDTGMSLARLDRLRRDTGCTVVILHHSTKTGTGERGSSALRGAMDAVISLNSGDDGLVRVECEKQRNGPRFSPMHLRLDREALVFRPIGSLAVQRVTGQQLRAVEVLRELTKRFPDGVPRQLWANKVIDAGVPRRTAYDAIGKLVMRGVVSERGTGSGLFDVV